MKPNSRVKCDMQTSLQRQWKDTWQGLDVGHRGAGSSFKAEVKQCVNFLCFYAYVMVISGYTFLGAGHHKVKYCSNR